MFLGQFFAKDAINDPRTLFEWPKSDKFLKNRENAQMAGNSVKNCLFSTFKTPKLGHFSRYIHGILYTYTPDVFQYIPFFENSKRFPIF